MRWQQRTILAILSLGLPLLAGPSPERTLAAETPLEPFLTSDVVATAYVDFSDVDLKAMVNWAANLGLLEDHETEDLLQVVQSWQSVLEGVKALGVSEVYWLFRATDLSQGGPTWVIPLAKLENAQTVQLMLMFGDPHSDTYLQSNRPQGLPGYWDTVAEHYLVGAYTQEQLEHAKSAQPTERRSLASAWEVLGDGNSGIVIVGDQESRRVVKELMPELPFPLDGISGSFLADKLHWGGVSVTAPPEIELRIEIETADPQSAQQLATTLSNAMLYGSTLPPLPTMFSPELLQDALEVCKPLVEKKRVRIVLLDDPADAQRLAELLRPALRSARESAARNQRANHFKQIALAMLNYENANHHLPSQANYTPEGKPLLSWRVHVLPYLDDQLALYKEFHLDEPWDSEHNRTLIGRMPAVFADASPEMSAANRAGKTNYLVPVGKSTLFESSEPKQFRDVFDGTSNTIFLVEATSDLAVEWTKPADWEVDFADPWKGLPRQAQRGLTTAFLDGSVRFLPDSLTAEQLDGLLTPSGGEIVDMP